jgi:NADPH2:quinone reductase
MTTAISIPTTGSSAVMEVRDIDVPEPVEGEVRVRVAAAGVNFIDVYEREGRYAKTLPFILGKEGSGTVLAVGPGVESVAVGDRVAWESIPGSYAEEVVGPAARLVPVPEGLSNAEAAAFPLQGLTAHYLATTSHPIQRGETVLIHAGAGGVGLLLTQIATLLGARVLTTVSSSSTDDKKQLSYDAGAEAVLSYDEFPERVRELTKGAGVAAVYDGVGKSTFEGSLASLRRRGTLVLFGGASGAVPPFDPMRLAAGSFTLTRPTLGHFVADRPELLQRSEQLLRWIVDRKVRLRIGATYPLADAARAHDDLENRRTTGKLLLVP